MKNNNLTKKTILFILVGMLAMPHVFAQQGPDVVFGDLFKAVQMAGVFPDSKTFADCTPKAAPEVILAQYARQKGKKSFDLKQFVTQYFELPVSPTSAYVSDKTAAVEDHVRKLWPVLTRQPDEAKGSLIPLPKPYVVPGGRFREIYYWDSYFTMLGLQVSGETKAIEDMIANFAFLIDRIGFIPNGNRTYYLGRSQPPFFSLMVKLLAETEGNSILSNYLPQLEKEYQFWMAGAETLSEGAPANRRVVRLPGGEILNRYWDDQPTPRPESYREDVELAEKSGREHEDLYRNLRAACESGWDFSSRWLRDGQNLATIRTTELVPVDLNCLIYHLERTLAEAHQETGNSDAANRYRLLAHQRKTAIRKYCWNVGLEFYTDYDWMARQPTEAPTLAGLFPLYFGLATLDEVPPIAERIRGQFLQQGGLLTTPNNTGQQWDAPNGWAPLQWIAFKGLRNYNQTELAREIKNRWLVANRKVYYNTGKMMEKYDVSGESGEAGGGEYPNQDGFGWTNGVFLKLLSQP